MAALASTRNTIDTRRPNRFLWIGLVGALLLRIAVLLIVFRSADPFTDDGPYYILNAQQLWRIFTLPPAGAHRYASLVRTTSIGPLYPVFLAQFYNFIPDSAPVAQALAARLAQVGLDVLIAYLIYRLADYLFGRRVAYVALAAQALDLRYMFNAGAIATEVLFITLFIAFILIYVRASTQPSTGMGAYRWAGLLLGLSLLTRPVPLLFPAVLIVHGWLARRAGQEDSKRARRGAVWVTVIALALITPWMVRTAYIKGEFIPVSDSVFVHFYRMARADGAGLSTSESLEEAMAEDTGYGQTDNNTEGNEFIGAGLHYILASPFQWLGRIAGETGAALLQPFGTVIATPRGAGVKQVAADFLHGDASLGDVLTVPGFWRRLAMYLSHYWGLIGGLVGFGLVVRRRWWEIFPLAGWVVYVIGLMSVLLVEPRYLFPVMFVFTVLAAYATVQGWDWLVARRRTSENAARTAQSNQPAD